MSSERVSIIIPCYNAEQYVGEAIDSALGQSYPHTEVIVIDDGSTDGSVDVLRAYGDRIQWETGANRGACAARNRGLELATGEFIQFLDADDILHADKLSRQVPIAIESAPAIVCCWWRCEGVDGAGELPCSTKELDDSVIRAVSTVISTVAPLYPVESLRRVGGWREGLPCAQDFDLNLRLACAGEAFMTLPEVLVTLRRRSDSVSSDMLRVLDVWTDVYWDAYRDLQARGQMTDERAAAFAAGFASQGRLYIRFGEHEKARSRFREARQMHPSGGLQSAYQPWARLLRRVVGPVATEWLVLTKRKMTPQKFAHNN